MGIALSCLHLGVAKNVLHLVHTQVSTTQRYAHLSPDTLLEAANSVHKTLGGMFATRDNAKALTLEPVQVA